MQIIEQKIADVIAQNIKNPASLFVFPTDVACTSWVDWAIKNPTQSGCSAFNLDQFMAWDAFKITYFAPKDQSLRCISAVVRRIFCEKLIARHNQNRLFRNLIGSGDDMKEAAFGFASWMAKILPSLKLWQQRQIYYGLDKNSDEEDQDYVTLLTLYEEFLEEAGFYENSYVAQTLRQTDRVVFIFYPELLEDFVEYEVALKEAMCVTWVKLPQVTQKPKCVLYADARAEIRFLALRLRKLQYSGVDLRRVAVNVPDLETIRPYLEKELASYSVPFVMRAGESYTKNCAGGIFQKIKDCAVENFSYDAVRSLLLDGFVPWKNPSLHEEVVRTGSERRCVCAFQEQVDDRTVLRDTWLLSLDEGSSERNFYLALKKAVQAFAQADTFSDIRGAWMSFARQFIDQDKFTQERYALSNKVLGKILAELSELILIERQYAPLIQYKLHSPFDFFVDEISHKTYEPDLKKYGVNVFPYGVASCADFDFQFVINSAQDPLSVAERALPFISDVNKRAALHLDDRGDSASTFINLYAATYKDGECKTASFSAASLSFAGFSIVHSALEEILPDKNEKTALEALDFVAHERMSFITGDTGLREMSSAQKKAFANWKMAAVPNEASVMSHELKNKVDFALRYKGSDDQDRDRIKVSQSELSSFFECPRKFMFKNVLSLQEDTLDVGLTKSNEIGNLVHKMVELICQSFKEKGNACVPLFPVDISAQEIAVLVDDLFEKAKLKTSFAKSSLALKVIESQKRIVCDTVSLFLRQFCSPFSGTKDTGFAGFAIDGVETEGLKSCNDADFDYFGRIDCVLANPKDPQSLVVIDYKTGTPPKRKDCTVESEDRLVNFQMACYVKLLETDSRKVDVSVFYGIKKETAGNFTVSSIIPNGKRDAFDATLTELERCAKNFTLKCSEYDLEPVPFKMDGGDAQKYGVKVFGKCSECTFAAICRLPYNIGKREFY